MSQSLASESLLDRFDISSEDLALLKECGRVVVLRSTASLIAFTSG
jgi:hypothetical protein